MEKKIDAIDVTKTVLRHLVRHGVAGATSNIVARNRPTSDNETVDTYHKVSAVVGGYAAGWFVGDIIANFALDKFDEAHAWVNQRIINANKK